VRELLSKHQVRAPRLWTWTAITAWIRHGNAIRLQSSIGNVSPIEWGLNYCLEALGRITACPARGGRPFRRSDRALCRRPPLPATSRSSRGG